MTSPLVLAERNVPRYTSYPTAPHFTAAVDAGTYGKWLDALPADARISLYIHVPFCTELCSYCGCSTRAVRRRDPVDLYAQRILDEIGLLGGLAGRKVVHLHWGGGTPSILGASWLRAVSDRLSQSFDLTCIKEHAIELDPRRIDRELVRTLRDIGVSRASLGVQDVSPRVQQAIGRIQPFELVEQAADWLRSEGICGINIDLMYGLPTQTARDVARSAELAASLGARRLALFGYAHVPWFRPHQRLIDDATLPDPQERIEQVRVATETLTGLGYLAVGLDHFALPDDELAAAAREHRLHRNFQGYTTDDADALIGLGASAIGRLPQGFVQNAPDAGGYSRAVSSGRFATTKGLALTDDDRIRGSVIERLMCELAVDLAPFGGWDRFAPEVAKLAPLEQQGLVTLGGERIAVTESGRPYLRLVAAVFDSYLAGVGKRHSIAV